MDNYMDTEVMLDLLGAIRYELWKVDIPSPTVPEYIEHHEQITKLIKFVDDMKEDIISGKRDRISIDKERILRAGSEGKELLFAIDERIFAIRELP